MSDVYPSSPANESLLVVNPMTGGLHERNFSLPEGSFDPVEQKLELMNCLGQLAAASMCDSLLNHDLTGKYGKYTDALVAGATVEKAQHITQAKWSFARAMGQFALVEAGETTEDEAKRVTRRLFSDFLKKYYGPRHYDEAQAYLRELGDEVTDLRMSVSQFNREHGLRPHNVTEEIIPDELSEDQKQELRNLSSRERMNVIVHDPRAGFIPTSDREKTMVMSYLDYLDNPEYPLGVNNQLFEVHRFQVKRKNGNAMGARAMESIVWEMGDVLADAAQGYRQVGRVIDAANEGVSPNVRLNDEFTVHDEALPYIVRHDLLSRFTHFGETDGFRNPLKNLEYRWAEKSVDPGKHKTVHSHFIVPDRPLETTAYINERIQVIKMREATHIARESQHNDIARAAFMTTCLHDVLLLDDDEHRSLRTVVEAAKASLAAIANEPIREHLKDELFVPVT